jgi:predicted permease
MQGFAGDVRYAIRQLLRTPGFTLTALLTLALGIGVNAAMFSVVDQALLRRVPYAEPERLVQMGPRPRGSANFSTSSLPDILDWRARAHAFDSTAYYTMQIPTLGGTSNPQLVPQVTSSANLFQVIGLHAAMGRLFLPGDDKAGHTDVLVLSDSVWRRIYNSDPKIVGKAVPVNGVQSTVIGVLPPDVDFPENAGGAIFSPLPAGDKDLSARDSSALLVIGRLRPGVTPMQAQNELEGIHQQLQKEYAEKESADPIGVELYQDTLTDSARGALLALSAAVIAVWLIACANVAGLMLARSNSRHREIAIRGALGASRSRLMQQTFTESMLLSVGGGLLGLAFAGLALKALSHTLGNEVRHGADVHINVAVCIYLLLASCLSAIFFGMAPAWHAAHLPAQEGLREGSAAAGTGRRQARMRDLLVTGEIALTVVLLIAAGLMMQTLWNLRHTQLGFAPQNLVTTSMFLPTAGGIWWDTGHAGNSSNLVTAFYQPLVQGLRHTAGIEAVGLSTVRPMTSNVHFNMGIQIIGMPKLPKGQQPSAQARASSPDFFSTIGVKLLRGRYFNESDRPGTVPVAIVNEAFVRSVLPGVDPLGKQIDLADDSEKNPPATIVGVVADSQQDSLAGAPQPEMHLDLDQLAPGTWMYTILAGFHMDLAIRTRLTPTAAVDTMTRQIHALEPEMALQGTESMQQIIDDSLSSQTLAARLLGIFGAAALIIAVAGIYGLLSYSVSQRTRELGVRIALGAQSRDVLFLVLRRACLLLGVGIGAGIAISWMAGGILRSFLYGLHAYDLLTVLAVAVVLGAFGIAASYLPARRASLTDPMEALRTE